MPLSPYALIPATKKTYIQINTEDGLTRIVNLVVDTVSNMVQILQSCQGFLMSQSERMGSGRGGGQSPPKAEDSIEQKQYVKYQKI
jgi:hypothetical protein